MKMLSDTAQCECDLSLWVAWVHTQLSPACLHCPSLSKMQPVMIWRAGRQHPPKCQRHRGDKQLTVPPKQTHHLVCCCMRQDHFAFHLNSDLTGQCLTAYLRLLVPTTTGDKTRPPLESGTVVSSYKNGAMPQN